MLCNLFFNIFSISLSPSLPLNLVFPVSTIEIAFAGHSVSIFLASLKYSSVIKPYFKGYAFPFSSSNIKSVILIHIPQALQSFEILNFFILSLHYICLNFSR